MESESKYTRKPITAKQVFMEHGKLPPQAVDLEEAVLGALMLQPTNFDNVATILKPECFYKESHQAIARAIYQLKKENKAVDILTVTNQLKSNGELELAGGAFYVTQLTSRIASTENIEEHAGIVLQKFLAREAIRISNETIIEAYEDTTDVFDLLAKTEKDITSLNQNSAVSTGEAISDVLVKTVKNVELTAKLRSTGKISGLSTGFKEFDLLTNGFQNGELIIPAGRPGMGKTAYTLHMTKENAKNGKQMLFFSLEMPAQQLARRMVIGYSGIEPDYVKTGKMNPEEWQRFHEAVRMVEQLPIIIYDKPCTIADIKNIARKNNKEQKLDGIVIDYLQLILPMNSGKSSNRDQDLGEITRSLKALAKELDLPVICLSQLNRSVETRSTTNKIPKLSDLRESGNIEQDADMVFFLYRPEYYGIEEDSNGKSLRGVGKIIIAKYREGANTEIKFRYNPSMTLLSDFVDEFEPNHFPEVRNMPVNNRFEVERNEPPS